MQGYDIDELYREAQSRWLKPVEILYILQNQEKYQLTQEAPQKPTSGSLFLFNKRVLRFFRKDGHNWRKKKDGRTVGEAHERLKVGNFEALNCYYAHGEQNPTFQRRIYWMLDPAYEHIVLVHYREINKGKPSFGSIPQLSPESSSIFNPTPGSYSTRNPGSTSFTIDYSEQYQAITSPESIEVSSKIALKNNGIDSLDSVSTTGELTSSSDFEVSQALRRLEEQLSLNEDSIKDIPFSIQNDDSYDSGVPEYERETSNHSDISNILYAPECTSNEFGDCSGMQNYPNNFVLFQNEGSLSAVDSGNHHHQPLGNEFTGGSKDSISWTDVLGSYNTSSGFELQDSFQGNNFQNSSMLMPQEVGNFSLPAFSSRIESNNTNTNSYPLFYDQGLTGMPLEGDTSLTVSQKQNFTIREISPEWAYTNEATKVIIVGSFLCDPSESVWKCMFGDIEVPVQIIQEGVIRCETPCHSPGKVSLCITSGNRESCSEVREFEYRVKTSNSAHSNVNQTESMKSAEELLLLVRFVQILLSDISIQEGGSEGYSLRKLEADDDSWSRVIEALLVGSGSSSTTIDWLLQELVKDKLQQWLSSRSQEGDDQPTCSLSRKEQGIIHMVAGLGFEWALPIILSCRVNIDFRDINGWTALHWAARFGREKMVAALVASGASAGAVTDPNAKDPTGRTPASIAASNGHKGLAGYLSEVALTSHLSSLRLEESELSKVSAEVEAEKTVNSISNGCLATNEDQLSLKNTLNAVRTSVQAAGRIQAAFRAHSFRRRQQRESGADIIDEYGISLGEIQGLSAMSKLGFGNAHNYNSAALSIQKKYRGWKGRKDFLALRQKVVKIQALVRGYQARKHYNVICWAVGFMDKVVLRWRRKGSGLRGFLNEKEAIGDKEDEDILKVFRKQKVDGALEKALKRVLSMVRSPEARQQYQRMLERYHQAKGELGASSSEAESSNDLGDFFDMENGDFLFQ